MLRFSSNSHRYQLSPTDRATTRNSRQMEDWLICLFRLSTSKWMGFHPAVMGARRVSSLDFLFPLGSGNSLSSRASFPSNDCWGTGVGLRRGVGLGNRSGAGEILQAPRLCERAVLLHLPRLLAPRYCLAYRKIYGSPCLFPSFVPNVPQ